MNKYIKLFIAWTKLMISAEAAYRWNSIIKAVAMVVFDFFAPLIAIIIYSVSSGIPGWSFEQFLLLSGTFTIVEGLNEALFGDLGWGIIWDLRHGEFDMSLVKPYNTLGFMSSASSHPRSFVRVFVGLGIVTYALVNYAIAVTLVNLLFYVFLILLGLVFLYSTVVLISSLAILFVQTSNLMNALFNILLIGRYPLNVYGSTGVFVFTFIFPLGVAAFYPASALLHGISLIFVLKLALIIMFYLVVNVLLWNFALKKYSSAGG